MKWIPVFLIASFLANIALLVAYTRKAHDEEAHLATHLEAAASATTISSTTPPTNTGRVATSTETRAVASRRPWAELKTNDLDELNRRLKAAGYNFEEIRAIMRAQIMEKSNFGREAAPYWRPDFPNYNDPKVREKQAEEQALYRKYIWGPEHIADDPEQLQMAQQQYGPLPVDKLQKLATIAADYSEKMMKRENGAASADQAAARAELQRLQKQNEEEIKNALTPEEYAIYELRAGPIARQLRSQLEAFRPNEEEYKALFAIHKSFNERLGDSALSGAAHEALRNEMMNHVVGALGHDRALDYQEASRGSNDQTARLVAALELPARVAGQVRAMQKDFTEQAQIVRADAQLSTEERAARLAAIAQEARTKLGGALGPEGFETYNDMKGEWIRALEAK